VLQVGIRRQDEARLLAHRIVRALSAPYSPELRGCANIGASMMID
jgi:hypothetical protein